MIFSFKKSNQPNKFRLSNFQIEHEKNTENHAINNDTSEDFIDYKEILKDNLSRIRI